MELGSDGRQVLAIAFPPAAQDFADALLERRQAAIVPVLWQMLHSLLRFHLDQSLVLPGGPPVQARIAPEGVSHQGKPLRRRKAASAGQSARSFLPNPGRR